MQTLFQSLPHPTELFALLKFKLGNGTLPGPLTDEEKTPTFKRCLELLDLTSRSFAAVIKALDAELRRPVCLFYLVLRGLDTVEDDMTIDIARKRPLLIDFHKRLYEAGWTFIESGPNEKDRQLLVEFDVVIGEFLKLKPVYQTTIADICARMGKGMSDFLDKGVGSMEEWDLYCHYVAGLVGIGLSKLFSSSGLEEERVGSDERLSNSMGLFLQKTNIIRDYLEDVIDGRVFWPKAAWSVHADAIEGFRDPAQLSSALACLNGLVANALAHVPDVYEYMSRLKTESVVRFCAIPQVMAIATLTEVYNNPKVFTSVVKIRKGTAVLLMDQSRDYESLLTVFRDCALALQRKLNAAGAANTTSSNSVAMQSAIRLIYAQSLERSALPSNQHTAQFLKACPPSFDVAALSSRVSPLSVFACAAVAIAYAIAVSRH